MSERLAVNAQCFGLEFTKAVVAAPTNLSALQRRLASIGYDVSVNHLSDISRSERGPSPDLIDAIAKALRLPKDKARVLHRAAALDRGFKIGSLE